MENIELKGHKDEYFVPTVSFNAETGICEISGESYLDDTAEFYDKLLQWLEDYFEKVNKPITMNIKLTYFNTSSSKRIYQILCYLKDYEEVGGKVSVNWYFKKDDTDLIDEVEDLQISAEIDIKYIMY